MRARRSFLGTRQGGHLSPKRGHGIEFSDYRQYELGDNPRHIDWGLFGRTERLYVKRFQEEQDLQVLIALDASASMGSVPDDHKWERSSDIALSLAYIALMSQDTVRLHVLGRTPSAALIGPRAFYHATRYLQRVVPTGEGVFDKQLAEAAARVKFPGIAIIISDCLFDFESLQSGLNALRAKNLDITLIQVLGRSDRRLDYAESGATLQDSETGEQVSLVASSEVEAEFQRLLVDHCERIQQFCLSARVGYTLALPEEALEQWVNETLPRTGIIR
jgi:uncharacterized protein (DUF58 family)